MENELLKMENVSKSYLEDGGGDLLILRDINLTLKKGEVVAITGKSGCGKSTLLSVAALLSRRDNGKIYYSGLDVDQIPPKDLSALRNRKMGFVFQSSMLLEDFSALENVAMPLLIRGVGRKEAYSKAKEYLALVDIFDRMDIYIKDYFITDINELLDEKDIEVTWNNDCVSYLEHAKPLLPEYSFDFDILDMICYHADEIDLNNCNYYD